MIRRKSSNRTIHHHGRNFRKQSTVGEATKSWGKIKEGHHRISALGRQVYWSVARNRNERKFTVEGKLPGKREGIACWKKTSEFGKDHFSLGRVGKAILRGVG